MTPADTRYVPDCPPPVVSVSNPPEDTMSELPLDRVLVGVDFSGPSLTAARWVACAVARGTQFTLATVQDTARMSSADRGGAGADDWVDAQLADLSALLTDGRATRMVLTGRPHEALDHAAAEVGADLIAVGAHGFGARALRPLGTTAERLAHGTDVPVLVVAGSPDGPPRRIVVGVDDDVTPRVLGVARALSERFDAHVHPLHVLENADMSHLLSMAAALAHGDDAAGQRMVESELAVERARWRSTLAAAGVWPDRLEPAVRSGRAHEALIVFARTAGRPHRARTPRPWRPACRCARGDRTWRPRRRALSRSHRALTDTTAAHHAEAPIRMLPGDPARPPRGPARSLPRCGSSLGCATVTDSAAGAHSPAPASPRGTE